jgi:hypothetical protein
LDEVSCSLLTAAAATAAAATAAALYPRDAAPDIPLVGTIDGHTFRLDVLEK